MNKFVYPSYTAMLMGAFIALNATRAMASDIPWITLEHICLNPSNFYVSILVTNTLPNKYFALEAYKGEPVGATGGVERVIVSDWTEGTGSAMILYDTSGPLPFSGRTYNVAIAFDVEDLDFYILGPNEVYAPYPFFSSPVISSIISVPTNTGQVLAVTYGEGLYSNTVYFASDDATGFIRIKGTNNIPTNAVVERSLDPMTWTAK